MSGFRLEPFPRSRRIVVDAGRAARRRHPIHGLIEVDITQTLGALAELDPSPSITAFIVGAVGRSVEAIPEVHALRDYRGRLVIFDDVDINVMIEVELQGRSFPMNHVIRGCNSRTLRSIDSEIRAVKENPSGSPTLRLSDEAALFIRLPGFLRHRLVGLLHRLPHQQKKLAGTVGVSSVGMFGRGGGWGIGFSMQTLSIVVGGMVDRPALVDGRLEQHTYLSLSLTFDHDVVDGAPAARFVSRLRVAIENPERPSSASPRS